jgi:8-oxo-dGTP pyrophosphatase MutT (NUDIX family)
LADVAASVGWSLRDRIARLLHDTQPDAELVYPEIARYTPEQVAALRKFVPERLARAAVLVPLVERPEGLNVLLTLRASHLKNHAGQISFPGGRIEPHDDGPWEAALREATEEIGLAAEFVSRAGYLPDHVVITGFRVTPVVGFVRPGFELRLDTTEVEDVFEVPLEFVIDPAHHVARERHVGGVAFQTWEIPYGERRIWGATANMLLTLSRRMNGEPT